MEYFYPQCNRLYRAAIGIDVQIRCAYIVFGSETSIILAQLKIWLEGDGIML